MDEESRSICLLHDPPRQFTEGTDSVIALVIKRDEHAHAEVHTPFRSRTGITRETWQAVWEGKTRQVDAPGWVRKLVFDAYPDNLRVQQALGKAHPRYW